MVCPNQRCGQQLQVHGSLKTLRCPVCGQEWPAESKGPSVPDCFVALDFETANPDPASACAVGLVRVEHGQIVRKAVHLIRPPRPWFVFTHIHGISWRRVVGKPTFSDLWPELEPLLRGARFLAAHNASFDRSVLLACCRIAGVPPPQTPFLCTVHLARRLWQIRPTNLPSVCQALSIPLQHHEAGSDAEACARIVPQAMQQGWTFPQASEGKGSG